MLPVTAGPRIVISFAFLGVAFLAGYLTHSTGVFTAIVAVGLVVGLLLRLAR
jgi:hypothetical protein